MRYSFIAIAIDVGSRSVYRIKVTSVFLGGLKALQLKFDKIQGYMWYGCSVKPVARTNKSMAVLTWDLGAGKGDTARWGCVRGRRRAGVGEEKKEEGVQRLVGRCGRKMEYTYPTLYVNQLDRYSHTIEGGVVSVFTTHRWKTHTCYYSPTPARHVPPNGGGIRSPEYTPPRQAISASGSAWELAARRREGRLA